MQLSRYLYVPYRAARIPLAAIDSHVPKRTPVKAVTRTGLLVLDVVAARLFDEPQIRQPAESYKSSRPTSPSSARPAVADGPATPPAAAAPRRPKPTPTASSGRPAAQRRPAATKRSAAPSKLKDDLKSELQAELDAPVEIEREKNLREDRKRKEHSAARGNRNVASIAQEVARTEAAADAREHRAHETDPDA